MKAQPCKVSSVEVDMETWTLSPQPKNINRGVMLLPKLYQNMQKKQKKISWSKV